MTTRTNEENLQRYKSRFSSIVEQRQAFISSTNLVREVMRTYLQISKALHNEVLF